MWRTPCPARWWLWTQQGYVESANIMFLIIFSYGFVYVLTKNGTMDKAL